MRKLLISAVAGASLLGAGPVAVALAGSSAPSPGAAPTLATLAPTATSAATPANSSAADGDHGRRADHQPTASGKTDAPGRVKKSATPTTTPKPIIAMVDTGTRATHQEFDYQGPASTTDQFVGWWDFTSETKGSVVLPAPGQVWDDKVADPYDRNGHGTWTASMAAGRNVNPEKDKSAAPGFPLAIAKVGNGDGTIEGDIAAAIRWAAFTVDADVINVSIGSIVPIPTIIEKETYDVIAEARRAGKLVVVANGNGFANAGIPGDPGWASSYGSSTDVLSVGADDIDSYTVHTDPEVVAKFYDLLMADFGSDTGYSRASGTSFSSPFTAGVGARLLDEARTAGHDVGADYVEQLIKYTAADRPEVTPNFEGYGVVSLASLDTALPFARSATLPTRPSPDPSGLYVESGSGTLRDVWSNQLRNGPGLGTIVPLGLDSGNGRGVIGASAPAALGDAELSTINAPVGTTVTVSVAFPITNAEDIDVYVFSGTTGPFTSDRLVTSAATTESPETLTFRSPGPVTLVVLGYLLTGDTPVTYTSSAPLVPAGDGYVAHTMGTGF